MAFITNKKISFFFLVDYFFYNLPSFISGDGYCPFIVCYMIKGNSSRCDVYITLFLIYFKQYF